MAVDIFLGTLVLERNRWAVRPESRFPHLQELCACRVAIPTIQVSEWIASAQRDGFSGVELFEAHAFFAAEDELDRLARAELPVAVFNAYVGLGPADAQWRDAVLRMARRLGARAIKYNFGQDPHQAAAELTCLRHMAANLDEGVRLLCECHAGNLADEPAAAARLAAELPADRFGFIVHLCQDRGRLSNWLDALGHRVVHAHVWRRPEFGSLETLTDQAAWLDQQGYRGSYTIEFTSGIAWGAADPPLATLYAQAVADRDAIAIALDHRHLLSTTIHTEP